jgi:hypothetical protein
VLFGFHPAQLSAGQWRRFAGHGLYGVPVTGMPPGTAERRTGQALARFAAHPGLACLTLTEANPDHDPAGALTQELVSRWAAAIAAGLTR